MNPKLLSIYSQTCVKTCVSSRILLTWRPSSKPSPGTVAGGEEPQHPKEFEPRQGCLTHCSHFHSFKGGGLYNEIKAILTNDRACALLCEVNPGLPQSNQVKICFRLCLMWRQTLPSAWGSANQPPFPRLPEVATWISHLFITTTPFNRSFCFPVLTIISVSIL